MGPWGAEVHGALFSMMIEMASAIGEYMVCLLYVCVCPCVCVRVCPCVRVCMCV